jgi:hypothetical protein
VASVTLASLASDSISLLLVPNETTKPHKAPPGDAVTPGDIHEAFLPNKFFQKEAKALVKQIDLPGRLRVCTSYVSSRSSCEVGVVLWNPADRNPCRGLTSYVLVKVKERHCAKKPKHFQIDEN